MLCLHVFSSLGSSETLNSSQCLGTRYELSPVPHSLVDEFGYLLKGNTSVLMKRLGSDSESVPKPNVFLADHIVWRTGQTLRTVARHATQVVKSTKVQLFLSSLLNRHMKD